MIGQKNLRSFHNFLDFPVSWIQEKEPTKRANDKNWQFEMKPTGYAENERPQHSEGNKRKLELGMAHRGVNPHRGVRGMGLQSS